MNAYLAVFIGAGFGGALRHTVNLFSTRWFGPDLPAGTLIVNVAGSIVIGALAGYFAFKGQSSQTVRLFLTTGLLGGFTTFSAFSLETALMFERGQSLGAIGYVVASVALGVLGVSLGLAVVR